MKRDTKIVMLMLGAVPTVILAASALCAWAISQGASLRWRLLFRLMCHGRPERCLELFGVEMPICARCVGIYLGLLAGLAAFRVMASVQERILRMVALAAVMPLAIDGLTQLIGLRESTNPLRMATGVVAGFAFGLWILSAIDHRHHAVVTSS